MSTEASNPVRTSELVAGFLSVLSIVGSAVSVAYQPIKISPFAVILALVATGMAPPRARLPLIACAIAVVCFVAGMTIAVQTKNPLY